LPQKAKQKPLAQPTTAGGPGTGVGVGEGMGGTGPGGAGGGGAQQSPPRQLLPEALLAAAAHVGEPVELLQANGPG
jgi:hypothetical protein